MRINIRNIIYLSVFTLFFFTGVCRAADNVDTFKINPDKKKETENPLKLTQRPFFDKLLPDFSMKIIKPSLYKCDNIVKNNYDKAIDYKLRIIEPYTKQEITDFIKNHKKSKCIK